MAPTYNLEILDIRESGMKDVYDITVMNSHSFLANGVVAHNCLLANGCPAFVKDRLMEQSDEYRMWFCKVCGLPAIVVKGSPELNIPPSKECRVCQSKDIAYVKLPYATKLLMYEFMGMGIVFRVLTDSFEDPHGRSGVAARGSGCHHDRDAMGGVALASQDIDSGFLAMGSRLLPADRRNQRSRILGHQSH